MYHAFHLFQPIFHQKSAYKVHISEFATISPHFCYIAESLEAAADGESPSAKRTETIVFAARMPNWRMMKDSSPNVLNNSLKP
jgi:hypothetical protein